MKLKIPCKVIAKEIKKGLFFNTYKIFIEALNEYSFKQKIICLEVPDWQFYQMEQDGEFLISFYEKKGLLYPVSV